MQVVQNDLWLCEDCTMIACNGDTSGFESDARVAECMAGLDGLGPNLVGDFDVEKGEGYDEFSWGDCDCCGSTLGGSRHRFALLGD